MLKRIRTDQIELGMFIHRLEGNWFRHPFWKARFVLDDPARLQQLRDSRVPTVVIDLSRGRDPAPVSAPAADRGPVAPRPAMGQRPAPPSPRRAPDAAREFSRAERLARQAGKAVSRLFLEARLGKHLAASEVEPVIEDIYASIQGNIYAFNGLLRCQSEQAHLYRHALAVCALMIALARRMRLPAEQARAAGMAGLLMDIGHAQLTAEMGVSDYRDVPHAMARDHVLNGLTQLRAAGDIPPSVQTACLQHHERLDGSGFPQGIEGSAIGLLGRMAAICDVYDHLVTGTAETPPLDPAHALEHLRASPAQFDAALVERLVEAVGVYPIGSFVRLRSGRLAMVIDQDQTDIALPVVRIFAVPGADCRYVRQRPATLALGQCYGEDAIEGIAEIAELAMPPAEQLRAEIIRP
jgi:HD-GYP domain-containing protein (c-di-GMP phosphodiesterase class II)